MAKGLKSIKLNKIQITDSFFQGYLKLVSDKIIPYQWDILNDRVEDAAPTFCINNFRIAAGEMEGKRRGVVFQDTDLYKWIEAVAYCIENGGSTEFEDTVDEVVGLIGRAQQPDGYLNTYYTVVQPNKRWSNLVEGHELYCSGHMIEAAVAYYTATGKKQLLEIAKRNADLICRTFDSGEGCIKGYPGHQEIELALIKLYRVTGEQRYLKCARHFIHIRGSQPNYLLKEIEGRGGYEFFHEFDHYDLKYAQAHLPPIEQRFAEGHAVRAMYMYSAMADLALEYGDDQMLETCKALWTNVTKRRMYITGSIGTSAYQERFTTDYDLPNQTNYSETCASIGLMMFGRRMNALTKDASYYEVVERALYNTVLAGIGLTGDRYFYVNPLEVVPEFCTENSYMMHVKPSRQKWFSVACCPPNIARTLASLGQYIFAQDDTGIYINQFISSTAEFEFAKDKINVEMDSELIQNGKVRLIVKSEAEEMVSIKVRIPEYAGQVVTLLNGSDVKVIPENGYACFCGIGKGNHQIEIDFDVRPRWVSAHDNVREDVGKVALMKGPCVYCLEERDNGKNLASVYVLKDTMLQDENASELYEELPVLHYSGFRIVNEGLPENELYGTPSFKAIPVNLRAVPYSLWNNRGEGEMLIWQKICF